MEHLAWEYSMSAWLPVLIVVEHNTVVVHVLSAAARHPLFEHMRSLHSQLRTVSLWKRGQVDKTIHKIVIVQGQREE
jgi:hypothetical protein